MLAPVQIAWNVNQRAFIVWVSSSGLQFPVPCSSRDKEVYTNLFKMTRHSKLGRKKTHTMTIIFVGLIALEVTFNSNSLTPKCSHFYPSLKTSAPAAQPLPQKRRRALGLSYLIDENPPWYICLLLGFQVRIVNTLV